MILKSSIVIFFFWITKALCRTSIWGFATLSSFPSSTSWMLYLTNGDWPRRGQWEIEENGIQRVWALFQDSQLFILFFFFNLFIWLHWVLVATHWIFDLRCGMWDLSLSLSLFFGCCRWDLLTHLLLLALLCIYSFRIDCEPVMDPVLC